MPWRVNGVRVYKVKGVRKSAKKTYKTKTEAFEALKRKKFKVRGPKLKALMKK